VIFSIGALSLAWFVARLWIAPRKAGASVAGGAVERP
jgi:hypothetical protein